MAKPYSASKTVLIGVTAVLVLIGYVSLKGGENLLVELYYDWFGLHSSSTVADYRAASVSSRLHWFKKMCNDGVCLHRIDWRCGFSTSSRHPNEFDTEVDAFGKNVTSCFGSLVNKAPLTDTIGKLRLLCGRKHMVFVGNLYATPDECTKAGGQWGRKAKLFGDEDKYFDGE